MEDEHVQRAAKLLLQGARMLHITCPNCKDPIYQLRDDTYICATCEQNVIFAESQSKADPSSDDTSGAMNPIDKKIAELSLQLEIETNPDKILELATLIKNLQNL